MEINIRGIHIRRYVAQMRKDRHGATEMVFSPILQTGNADKDKSSEIVFSGATPIDAYSKAFNAGFRYEQVENSHDKDLARWRDRWP